MQPTAEARDGGALLGSVGVSEVCSAEVGGVGRIGVEFDFERPGAPAARAALQALDPLRRRLETFGSFYLKF